MRIFIDEDSEIDTNNNVNILFCSINGKEASVQTQIHVNKPNPSKITEPDLLCGVDTFAFIGVKNIISDSLMLPIAGVTLAFFKILLNLIVQGRDGQPKRYVALNKDNRLLLFLMKLKLGLTFTVLGILFCINATTASRIFYQMLETITIKTESWIFWPSKESVKKNMPLSFYKYPNCRCIIDCTEVETDTPPTVKQRVLLYSNYKGRFTLKFLVCITPDGFTCLVSKAYGGRATDSFINNCKLLSLIEPGDLVLADKGFPQIKSELAQRNAILVIPPFAFDAQFTSEQMDETYNIASVRIHVEQAIQRIKIFNILRHIPNTLIPCINEIMHVCCVLANNKPPLIKEGD